MFIFIYRDTIDYVYESHKPKAEYNYLHALSDYVAKHTEIYRIERQTEGKLRAKSLSESQASRSLYNGMQAPKENLVEGPNRIRIRRQSVVLLE